MRRVLRRGNVVAQTCVLFTAPEKRLSAMDVATGPCVPLPGRKTSVVSVHQQEGPGEEPGQMKALYGLLTGDFGGDPLELVDRSGTGALYRCSSAFVDAMTDTNQELVSLADEDKARNDPEFTLFVARRDELASAWLRSATWPPELVSTQNRLLRIGKAAVARDKGQPLYCWHGPAVPVYEVVAGYGAYPVADRRRG